MNHGRLDVTCFSCSSMIDLLTSGMVLWWCTQGLYKSATLSHLPSLWSMMISHACRRLSRRSQPHRALSTTARLSQPLTSSSSTTSLPFSFLPANSLTPKSKRTTGLTEIRGPYYAPVTATYLDELLSDWGEYVDGIKFAGGAFSLMPEERLKGLIDVCHKHGESTLPQYRAQRLT